MTRIIDALLSNKCELYILLFIISFSCFIFLIPLKNMETLSGLMALISLIGLLLRRYCCICIREKYATSLFSVTGAFAYYYSLNPLICSIISLLCLTQLILYINTRLRGMAFERG